MHPCCPDLYAHPTHYPLDVHRPGPCPGRALCEAVGTLRHLEGRIRAGAIKSARPDPPPTPPSSLSSRRQCLSPRPRPTLPRPSKKRHWDGCHEVTLQSAPNPRPRSWLRMLRFTSMSFCSKVSRTCRSAHFVWPLLFSNMHFVAVYSSHTSQRAR